MRYIVIHSGGLDSSVLLAYLKQQHEVRSLSIDYGQRHRTELEYADRFCEALYIPHCVADLRNIRALISGSSQTSDDIAVPHGHYAAENMKTTVVPNRNMIMLAVAIGHAISQEADAVAFAAHAGDHTIYPDCRPEFVETMRRAASLADWRQVSLAAPFVTFTKARIVQLGANLGVPLHLTYSCYEGKEHHCGKCGTCQERKEAFQVAGVEDPTVYDIGC